MKKINIFIALSLLVILNSCTETLDSIELPYTEKVVIRGILEQGKEIKNISITKTLPALDSFDLSKAAITDADVNIIVDNITYKLKHNSLGNYDSENLIAESGKKYELHISWRGKKCYAFTTVPYPIEILEISKLVPSKSRRNNLWIVGLLGKIKIPPGVAVVGGYQYIDSLNKEEDVYRYQARAFREQDSSSKGFIKLQMFTAQVPDTNNIQYDYLSFKLYNLIEAYDEQFFDYFKTRSNGETIASTFGFTSSDVTWNIQGEGIGLFIGVAKTRQKYIQ